MKIALKNIGIIQDSYILLDGLTVITGDNNSGKTTVGKVLYCLIDAVSNIKEKAARDKRVFFLRKLEMSRNLLLSSRLGRAFFSKFRRLLFEGNLPSIDNEVLSHFFDLDFESIEDYTGYLKNLIDALIKLAVNINEKDLFSASMIEYWEENKNNILAILQDAQRSLDNDAELTSYTRTIINMTLNKEFFSQIQPVANPMAESAIKIMNGKDTCFDISIKDNRIDDDNKPVYFSSPLQRVFFIDNPFIVDEKINFSRNLYRQNIDDLLESNFWFESTSAIYSHGDKLNMHIFKNEQISPFEETVNADKYKSVTEKVNSVLPGDFFAEKDKNYYIYNNIKLRSGNLATGSKLFFIIKRLLQTGSIDSNTLLILDEPESHLHPGWQNAFGEVIAILVKEINVKVLLTTHSPNLALALDAYMRKYEINKKTHFYITDSVGKGAFKKYRCVDDDLGEIYDDFVKYFTEMKILRNAFLHGDVPSDDK